MNQFKTAIEDMASRSLRCVALAYRPFEYTSVPFEEDRDTWALPEVDLILMGIVGIKVLHHLFMILIFYEILA